MKLTFLGATGTVTGSKYLVQTNAGERILVDCGLYQGLKELRLRNWAPLKISPSAIDKVVLTHAHIDHSGYLPLLVKNGFTGPIYATPATYDLCSILLPDSAYLQEEDAMRANKYGYSKHKPALPLYTRVDAEAALKQFKVIDYQTPLFLNKQDTITWHRAGHILGASFVQFDVGGIRTLFTGDIGRLHDPVMKAPSIMDGADYLIIESTYGDRLHDQIHPKERLAEIIHQTVERGGTLLIPAFAVGRAQNILYYLYLLKQENRIPNIPIYLDSPMAIDATGLMHHHIDEIRLTKEQCQRVCKIATYTRTVEESKLIDQQLLPKIVISASGMATGGRILHHLKMFASNHRNTILFTGFQAEGTRGNRILRGESEVKMFGEMIEIHAQIEQLTNTSAHADYAEILTWLNHFKRIPMKTFIVHGEPDAAKSLKEHIEKEFKWRCEIPKYLDEVKLN